MHCYTAPLVENRGVIVNTGHVYSTRRKIFNIVVEQLMSLMIYLANPPHISLTTDIVNILWKRSVGSQCWLVHPNGCYYHYLDH
jgi:hypothetical protein